MRPLSLENAFCIAPATKYAPGGSQSAAPPTKSAHGGSQSASPATKSAHGGSQSAVPDMKSAPGGSQSAVLATKSAPGGSQSAAPATTSAHGGSQSAVPATKSAHGGSRSAVPATKSALQETSENLITMDGRPTMTRVLWQSNSETVANAASYGDGEMSDSWRDIFANRWVVACIRCLMQLCTLNRFSAYLCWLNHQSCFHVLFLCLCGQFAAFEFSRACPIIWPARSFLPCHSSVWVSFCRPCPKSRVSVSFSFHVPICLQQTCVPIPETRN